jgi:hypothetical protein
MMARAFCGDLIVDDDVHLARKLALSGRLMATRKRANNN